MNDYAPLLERAFALDVQEDRYRIENIQGDVPDFIRGTYYVNGPARFARGDFRYRHWLDGDGMVCSLRFSEAGISFANRFVRSKKYVDETEAGRPLYRAFGTAFKGDQMIRGIALASPVNVSAYPFAGALLAFGEQGLPYELDLVTLETRGEYTFGKRLNAVSPFSAHPKFDSDTGEMFNFGVSFSATSPALNLYRFDAEGALLYRRRYPLFAPCSVHDFALSQHYAVFYLSPYALNMNRLIGEGASLMDALDWMPQQGSMLLVIARETGDVVAWVPIGQRYCLHLIHAFDSEDMLTVDVIELSQPVYDQYQVIPDLFTDVRDAFCVRMHVSLKRQEMRERRALNYAMMCDFPAMDPRRAHLPCKDFWVLGISQTRKPGRKFLDQLAHLSWKGVQDVYQAPKHWYLGGEPVFVSRPGQVAGVVMCQVFDASERKSFFAIFDAFAVARGPLAMLELNAPIPLGFHACFAVDRGGKR